MCQACSNQIMPFVDEEKYVKIELTGETSKEYGTSVMLAICRLADEGVTTPDGYYQVLFSPAEVSKMRSFLDY